MKQTEISTGRGHAGPNPGLLAIIYTLLFGAGLWQVVSFTGGPHFPGPWESGEVIAAYFQGHAMAALWCGFLQFGAAIPLGILIAGICIPAAFHKLLPKWLIVFGLLIAVAGELSWLDLITAKALPFIPLTRFPGFVWLIAAGFMLPKAKPGQVFAN